MVRCLGLVFDGARGRLGLRLCLGHGRGLLLGVDVSTLRVRELAGWGFGDFAHARGLADRAYLLPDADLLSSVSCTRPSGRVSFLAIHCRLNIWQF